MNTHTVNASHLPPGSAWRRDKRRRRRSVPPPPACAAQEELVKRDRERESSPRPSQEGGVEWSTYSGPGNRIEERQATPANGNNQHNGAAHDFCGQEATSTDGSTVVIGRRASLASILVGC